MSTISVEQAASGMVLAADVLDRRGRLLIPAGRALAQKHVEALRMWGVERIDVEGDAPRRAASPEIPPALLIQARKEVELLFRNAGDDHPFLEALKSLSTQRRARAQATSRPSPEAGAA